MAYHENLDRLRAERSWDAAQAAVYPHVSKDARGSWLRDVQRRTTRRVVPQTPAGRALLGSAPFTVNGEPADAAGLKRWLVQTFGMTALPAESANGGHA